MLKYIIVFTSQLSNIKRHPKIVKISAIDIRLVKFMHKKTRLIASFCCY